MKVWLEEDITPNGLVYRVVVDGFTVGEFRQGYWASVMIEAIKKMEEE